MIVPYAMKPLPWTQLGERARKQKGEAYHDVVRETLPEVAAATVSPERDRAEEHLHPAEDGVCFSNDAVQPNHPRTQRLFVYVKLEVYAERELQR